MIDFKSEDEKANVIFDAVLPWLRNSNVKHGNTLDNINIDIYLKQTQFCFFKCNLKGFNKKILVIGLAKNIKSRMFNDN